MSMPPAPQPRQPRTVEISGRRFRIRPLPTRAAFRAHWTVVRAAGDFVAGLLSGDGIRVSQPSQAVLEVLAERGEQPADDGSIRIGIYEVLRFRDTREVLANEIRKLERLSADALMEIVDELVLGHVDFDVGGTWAPISSERIMDEQVPGHGALLELLKQCYEVSLGPSTAGGATSTAAPPASSAPSPPKPPTRPRRR